MASSCLAFLFRQHIAAFKSGQSRGADLNARNAFVPWRTLEEEKQTLKRNTKERRIQEEKRNRIVCTASYHALMQQDQNGYFLSGTEQRAHLTHQRAMEGASTGHGSGESR